MTDSHKLGRTEHFKDWWSRGTNAAHGTRQRYKMGCHCDPCTQAASSYRATFAARKADEHADTVDVILEILYG